MWFDTSLAEFHVQLAQLEKAGAKPISLAALERWLTLGTKPPPPGAVVLCFDDNTRGIYEHAFPELQKRGWPFVVSVHTAFVGVTTGKAHCTWEQLQAMAQGGATLVSQTHSHPPDLRLFSDTRLDKELMLSKASLKKHLGIAPRCITYPSGKWDARVAMAAQHAGYVLGLTEDFGYAERSPHLLGIKRFSTHRRWSEALAAIKRSART